MKVVWVVNMPIGPIAKMLNLSPSSGLWLSAALEEIKGEDIELYVLCTCEVKEDLYLHENGITYVGLAMGSAATYTHTTSNLNKWKQILSGFNPDILQIWGTEYQHSLSAIMAKPEGCKALVYIQGVMGSVYDNYFGGIGKSTLWANTSLVELLAGKTIFKARKAIKRSADNEKKVMSNADAVILETKWSESYCRLLFGCKDFYHHALPINKAFSEAARCYETIEKHTIFTSAANYPLKGVHQLIKAVWLVKKEYPAVKLYVPGYKLDRDANLKQKLKMKSYRRYLSRLITSLDLWSNVVFTGPLSAIEMAERMEKAHVYVCSSAIENHSSTLREAMRVGVPSISTAVGGIPEFVINGHNGELYDFHDVTALAGLILNIFNDDEYAATLSNNAKNKVCEYYGNHSETLKDIYMNL